MHDVVARFNDARINSDLVENEYELLKQITKIIERVNASERYTFWRFDDTLHALILNKAKLQIKSPLYIVAMRGRNLQIRRGFSNKQSESAALARFYGYTIQP